MRLNAQEACTKIYKEKKIELVMNIESEEDVLCLEDRDFLFEIFQSMES